MYVFHDLKLIYIIVPGTGSNSFWPEILSKYRRCERIKASHGHPAWKIHPEIHHNAHFTAEQARMIIDPEIWESYQKISFVRHPYWWARSLYRKNATDRAVGIDNSGTFVQYLRKLEKTPYFWFTDSKGEVLINRILRTEDLPSICAEFKIKERYANQTKGNKEADRNKEVESILREKFRKEYKHYPRTDILGTHI